MLRSARKLLQPGRGGCTSTTGHRHAVLATSKPNSVVAAAVAAVPAAQNPHLEKPASLISATGAFMSAASLLLLADLSTGRARCDSATSPGSTGAAASPFVYPELQKGIPRRIESQRRLLEYMEAMRKEIQSLDSEFRRMGGPSNPNARHWYSEKMTSMRDKVNADSQFILYGVRERGARDRYMATYGCAAWTEEALMAVASFSPLIEIGAGKGQWQKKLTEAGADVLAYDNGAAVPCPDLPAVGTIRPGDHTQIAQHPKRTLFICYPEGDMAMQCLAVYRGNWLLYVGEGRGGVNANEAFFDSMEREWICERVVELRPFRECYEKLYVMRRAEPLGKATKWFGLF